MGLILIVNAFIYLFIYLFIYFYNSLNYRCISVNYNVVEKFIYFSNSTQIVKLVY